MDREEAWTWRAKVRHRFSAPQEEVWVFFGRHRIGNRAVFVVFAWLFLKERLTWNYGVSFVLIVTAVWFATAFKPGGPAPGGL
jgi:hypothetical protein